MDSSGYVIELILEDGETFAGKGGGDLEGVTIDAHANSVLLKPRAAIVATNLVIYSDRRAYRFDYSVEARPPNRFRGRSRCTPCGFSIRLARNSRATA